MSLQEIQPTLLLRRPAGLGGWKGSLSSHGFYAPSRDSQLDLGLDSGLASPEYLHYCPGTISWSTLQFPLDHFLAVMSKSAQSQVFCCQFDVFSRISIIPPPPCLTVRTILWVELFTFPAKQKPHPCSKKSSILVSSDHRIDNQKLRSLSKWAFAKAKQLFKCLGSRRPQPLCNTHWRVCHDILVLALLKFFRVALVVIHAFLLASCNTSQFRWHLWLPTTSPKGFNSMELLDDALYCGHWHLKLLGYSLVAFSLLVTHQWRSSPSSFFLAIAHISLLTTNCQ